MGKSNYKDYKRAFLRFYERHRRMPGYQELMELTGFRSKNAVFKLIEKFVEEGLVKKDAEGHLSPRGRVVGLPLLGLIEAGFPSPAEEELLDIMSFDEFLTPNKQSSYILRVKGDSMIDAGIHEGDMVVAERRQQYKPGQIVIANVDGEYTMKYLRKKGQSYYLEPANKKYPLIHPSESFQVEAVVTSVVRKYS